MDENELPGWFWRLIDIASSDKAQFDKELDGLERERLVDFYWMAEEAAAVLRGEPYTNHMAPDLSEDGIDDVAFWVLARGKTEYQDVVMHPERAPKDPKKPSTLLGAVERVHKRRFGEFVPYRP